MKISHDFRATHFAAVGQNLILPAGASIKGSVNKQGIDYPCIVSVHEHGSRQFIMQTETDDVGNYAFEHLNPQYLYFVMATDPASQYNAVIQDRIKPK